MQARSLRPRTVASLLSLLAVLGLLAVAPSGASLDLTLTPDRGTFAPGEEVTVRITGTPGSLVFFAADVSPGPILLPGGYRVDLGLTRELVYYVSRLDARPLTYRCGLDVGHPWFGSPTYIQAISIQPTTLEVTTSPSRELLWSLGTGG